MFNKMIQYTCPKCGVIGAHPIDMKPPLCHKCNYKTEMKPSINGKIIIKECKMTDEQLITEFKRWILADRPKVWYKRNDGNWDYVSGVPLWNSEDIYIVDDEQAELRKLQIDKPDTKFQILQYQEAGLDNKGSPLVKRVWVNVDEPDWDNKHNNYRVKPTEWYEDEAMVGKPV